MQDGDSAIPGVEYLDIYYAWYQVLGVHYCTFGAKFYNGKYALQSDV
jgi:hypothetical protein